MPEEVHFNLQRLASQTGTTLSKLIREGAEAVLKRKFVHRDPQRNALRFFANVPKAYKTKLTGKQMIDVVVRNRYE